MYTRRLFAMKVSLDCIFQGRLVCLFIELLAELMYCYQELQWGFSFPLFKEFPEEL